MNPDRYWSTGDELAFIERLGTHREQGAKIPRLTWLQNYLSVVTTLREEWQTLDKREIVKAAKAAIRKEQQAASRKRESYD